eukprot:1965838-Pleurochrysis_carterae.AAC.1
MPARLRVLGRRFLGQVLKKTEGNEVRAALRTRETAAGEGAGRNVRKRRGEDRSWRGGNRSWREGE